jgi:hypothetical protein
MSQPLPPYASSDTSGARFSWKNCGTKLSYDALVNGQKGEGVGHAPSSATRPGRSGRSSRSSRRFYAIVAFEVLQNESGSHATPPPAGSHEKRH